jgi:hypothetical protein
MIKVKSLKYRAQPSSTSSKGDLSSSSFICPAVFFPSEEKATRKEDGTTRLGCIECHHFKRIRKSPVRHFTGRLLGIVHQLGCQALASALRNKAVVYKITPLTALCIIIIEV